MKKRKDTSRVTIEIYDEDGLLCESVGGTYTHEEVKDQMIEILLNDGIPVIRRHAKHEAAKSVEDDNMPKLQGVLNAPKLPATIPMVLDYEFDGIKFHACGHPLDVHVANDALLKRIFEEEN